MSSPEPSSSTAMDTSVSAQPYLPRYDFAAFNPIEQNILRKLDNNEMTDEIRATLLPENEQLFQLYELAQQGLSAVKCLSEAGVSFIVLEANDRVGGRLFTKRNSKVDYVDIGGAYVGPTQDRLLRIAKELGIENYKVNEEGDLLYYKNGKVTRFPPCECPYGGNPLVGMEMNSILWTIDEMGEQIPHDAPWNAAKAEEWDTKTFSQFLKDNCWTQGAVDIFKNIINETVSSEAYEASLLCVLWYIAQCGGTKRIFSTTNGAQERKFLGGTQQICEKITERLGIHRVLLNSTVAVIDQESKQAIRVITLNGKEYKTKYVIVACPPAIQMKIHFNPPLPPLRNQLLQRAPMGTVLKWIIYYKTPFWREKGFCGSFFIEGEDSCDMLLTLDDTKPDGSYPALVGFIAGDKLRKMVILTTEERKNMIAQKIAEATGSKEAVTPVHYEEKNWMDEQYAGGGYTAMYPPGFLTKYGKVIRDPIDRMYFAGTETATQWSGYMEGAIQAGERAAREILCTMGKISPDRVWQNEPPSKEVVALPFETTFAEKYTPSVSGFLKVVALSTFALSAAIFVNYPSFSYDLSNT